MPPLGKETDQGQPGSARLGRRSVCKVLAAHVPDPAHSDLFSGGSLSLEGFLDVRPARFRGRGMLSAPPRSTRVISGP